MSMQVKKNKRKEKYDFMAAYLCLLVIKYKPLKPSLKIKIDPNPLTVLNSNTVNEFQASTKKNHLAICLIFSDFP
jgi:hypothetical protein